MELFNLFDATKLFRKFQKNTINFKKSNLNFKTKKILINGTRCEDSLNMWIAKNVQKIKLNYKYIKGGGQKSDRYNVFENHDIEISDKFYTWMVKKIRKSNLFEC